MGGARGALYRIATWTKLQCSDMAEVLREETSSEDDVSPESHLPSLLYCLRRCTPSDLARKRSVPCNPRKGLKKGKGRVTAVPSKVTPLERIKDFPGEHLYVENDKQFCKACREPLSLKKSVIKSGKNASGIERLKSKVRLLWIC